MAAGIKTGGRQKGTPNKAKAERLEAQIASGLSPLDYMLSVLRDESNPKLMRLAAAKDAAPYVHAKLANIELTGKDKGPLEVNIVRYTPAQPVGPATVPAAAVERAGERV